MKFELDLARLQAEKLNLPTRTEPPAERLTRQETVALQRRINVEVTDFTQVGVYGDDFIKLAVHLGRVAFATAGTLAQCGVEPTINDFAKGAIELAEDCRIRIGRALLLSDWDELRVATVQLEIVWYGIAANLSLPYHSLMLLLHESYMESRVVDEDMLRALLHKAGLPVAPPRGMAANEEPVVP